MIQKQIFNRPVDKETFKYIRKRSLLAATILTIAFNLTPAARAATVSFTNSNGITINNLVYTGPGNPYPSSITVTNTGEITAMRVRINGFVSSFPADVDVFLVAPDGQVSAVFSDVGSIYTPANVNFMFSDAATDVLSSTLLSSGTYLPLNNAPGEPLPPGATGSIGTALNPLAANGANGVWNLYVTGDNGADNGGAGSIASWSLEFDPAPQRVVNTIADSGPGSLRAAIDAALPGTIITFTNTLAGQTISLTTGQLVVDRDLNIDASALAGGIIIDGNGPIHSNRIFEIEANTTAVFDSLTLTNGLLSTNQYTGVEAIFGGAISINPGADLTLSHSTVAGNKSLAGGAILVDTGANLTLNHSIVADNSAGYGGGIMNGNLFNGLGSGGTVMLNHSSLNGNFAADGGGGIGNFGGTVTLNNSTLSGNSTSTDGGGIINIGMLTLNNSTLAGNSANNDGGGIYDASSVIGGGALAINNSTLTDNSATNAGGGIAIASTGAWGSSSGFGTGMLNNSIIAGNSASTWTNIAGAFASTIGSLTTGPPRLAPLGNYGGATQTMPPLAGSPAIDAGLTSATSSLTDQRGMPRVLSGNPGNIPTVDSGAVEYSGWLPGADLSGVDPDNLVIPAAAYYDTATLFPAGFDPATANLLLIQSQAEMNARAAQTIASVTNNPGAFGLYNESAFQALALDRPFLSYDSASNKFALSIGILQAPDLSTTFSNLTGFTTIPYPGDGQIDLEFDAPNSDVRFFEVYGTQPAPVE